MQGKFELKSHQYVLDAEGKSQQISESKEPFEGQTEICLNHYANKIFIIITQLNKIGAMVEGTVEVNPVSLGKEKFYDVKTIFGSRDREVYEIYCRAITELLNSDEVIKEAFEKTNPVGKRFVNPFANKSVIVSLALKPMENETEERKLLKCVLSSLKENLDCIV